MGFRYRPSVCWLLGPFMVLLACASEDNQSSGMDAAGGALTGTGGQASSSGGQATGGSTQNGTGGVDAAAYWSAAYNPAGLPTPSDGGYHAAGPNPGPCLACHGSTGAAMTKLSFGGTVYGADGVSPAANVEVGVSDGTNRIFVYSATNGLYWAAETATPVNWPVADIRMRNASGEYVKTPAMARSAECDSCHSGALVLKTGP